MTDKTSLKQIIEQTEARDREIVGLLEDVLESASLQMAEFAKMHPDLEGGSNFPTSEDEVTPFIRERTRIYMRSWIATPIEQALEMLRPPK